MTRLGGEAGASTARPVDLFVVWLRAAAQAVGGGGGSLLSSYNSIVVTRRWISPAAWAECWGICQVVPGVNIIAMALLTGSRLAGARGAGASLVGLVIPGVVAVLVTTALYTRVQGAHLVHSGLHGLVAAAAAATVLASWRVGSPVMRASAAHGRAVIVVAALVLVVSAVLIRTTEIPVFALLLAGGCALAFAMWVSDHRAKRSTS
jgi:chromate transporter